MQPAYVYCYSFSMMSKRGILLLSAVKLGNLVEKRRGDIDGIWNTSKRGNKWEYY